MRHITRIAFILIVCVALTNGWTRTFVASAAEDPHAYFNGLVKRSDHWKSYSLRSHAQMLSYRHSTARPMMVTYDPTNDHDLYRQDAAKVLINPFIDEAYAQLAAPVSAGATEIVLTATSASMTSTLTNLRAMKIDSEIVTIVRQPSQSIVSSTVTVLRGQHGTSAVSHVSGKSVMLSTNSLTNQLRLPVGTADGNRYLFTWDGFWTPSSLPVVHGIGNHKTFQFGNGTIWLQVDTRFAGGSGDSRVPGFDPARDIGAVGLRSLNRVGGGADWSATDGNMLGPNATSNSMLEPQIGTFAIKPNVWTRYWVEIDQRRNDYDLVRMWVADENRNAVQLYNGIQVSVRPHTDPPDSIEDFWLEFNTSANELQPGRGPMVAYVRNWVALRNVSDSIGTLLQRPGGGGDLPLPEAPRPPLNLRIVP